VVKKNEKIVRRGTRQSAKEGKVVEADWEEILKIKQNDGTVLLDRRATTRIPHRSSRADTSTMSMEAETRGKAQPEQCGEGPPSQIVFLKVERIRFYSEHGYEAAWKKNQTRGGLRTL